MIYMSENINNILISCSISTGLYIIYKTINHYRLRSSCNSNNELVISVVERGHPVVPEQEHPLASQTDKVASQNQVNHEKKEGV